MRVGVHVHPQHADYATIRRAWVEADTLGVDTIFTCDHFFPVDGAADGRYFEALALLAGMAEATRRAEISSLVFCNAYRNPHYLADALRTVDHISGGRAIMAVGAGWFARDFEEFGYELGTYGSRLDALSRDLPAMVARAGAGNPPPLRRMPVLVGGTGERKTLRIAAEHGDIWHAEGTLEDYLRLAAVLRRHCEDVGRDPGEIEHAWSVGAGDIALAEQVVDAGVGHVVVKLASRGERFDLGPVREVMQWRARLANPVV